MVMLAWFTISSLVLVTTGARPYTIATASVLDLKLLSELNRSENYYADGGINQIGSCDIQKIKYENSIMEQEKEKLIQKFFEGAVKSDEPTLYITYGPPGSGKNSILKKAMQVEGQYAEQPVRVIIDEVVHGWPGFKEELLNCKNSAEMQNLYWTARGRGGLGLDDVSDMILDRALDKHYNVGWETTGRTIDWTIKEMKRIKKMGYRIAVVYVYTQTRLLLGRMKRRWEEEKQLAQPPQIIEQTATLAATNFPELFPYADLVYLWDNNGNKGDEKLLLHKAPSNRLEYGEAQENNINDPRYDMRRQADDWECQCRYINPKNLNSLPDDPWTPMHQAQENDAVTAKLLPVLYEKCSGCWEDN